MKIYDIEYLDIEENNEYEKIVDKVLSKCFEIENLLSSNLYIGIMFTNPENIRKINKEHRGIDKETDVLSFPMFEKDEIEFLKENVVEDTLGDIIISIQRVHEQAEEYGHSFERELAYMLVHGFYHLMGEDHMEDDEKVRMREKEEKILSMLNITRD